MRYPLDARAGLIIYRCFGFAEGLGPLGLELGGRFRKEGKYLKKNWDNFTAFLIHPNKYNLFSLGRYE